ncbi:hypothetical protein [Bacillus sp. KH172YL63]|uniref:hypothetical protein n=1 Tax=Bacillus sp. KH172YL63 TaxID=2709784 RepID=UPI0013E4F7FE|nr:hypothetical protein [Bacillus sp. KH172YL63]BCB02967.1 hypothetical protein KH172YL63_11000 [Bacillus sp. KH172YL63]
MESVLHKKVVQLFIKVAFTMLALLGIPYLSYLETGRPMLEWSLIIGVLVTLTIIYVNGDGYFYRPGQYLMKQKKKMFYQSISFWTAFLFTVAAFYFTMKAYGNILL